MWAMTPSHRTGIVRHDWGSSNSAFTIDSLAACPLALSARASTGFSLHAPVPLTLSIRGKKLLYSRYLSEAAILGLFGRTTSYHKTAAEIALIPPDTCQICSFSRRRRFLRRKYVPLPSSAFMKLRRVYFPATGSGSSLL